MLTDKAALEINKQITITASEAKINFGCKDFE